MHPSRVSSPAGPGASTVLSLVREVVGHDETMVALASVTMSGKDPDDPPEEFVGDGSKGWWFHSEASSTVV